MDALFLGAKSATRMSMESNIMLAMAIKMRPPSMLGYILVDICIYSYFYLLTLSRLQKVQNSAARLVFKAHKYDHVQPLLQALHWLPVQAQKDYKLSAICHKFFSGSSPACLSDLTVYTPSRQLCSSAENGYFVYLILK